MKPSGSDPRLAVAASMICSGLVGAQFVAGKAARDAIYLDHLPASSLPQIIIATAIVSIILVAGSSKLLRRISPFDAVPWAFGVSALLFLAEWALAPVAPAASSRILYLHVSGLGPMLGSGFWLIATECFDPRSAKKCFSQIAGAGTLGGLLGALIAAWAGTAISIWALLPLLAATNVLCAWQIRRIARPLDALGKPEIDDLSTDLAPEGARSGLRVLASAPYLRHLALLVFLGSVGAAVVDYAFKTQAVTSTGSGEGLLRFFAVFYAVTGVATFAVQMTATRIVLDKLGISFAAGTPSLALLIGGCGGLAFPGLPATALARSGEAVFRGSLFRSGYEVFFTPIASKERRAAKSIIDVGFDRLGDAVGGGLLRVSQILPASQQYGAILYIAIGCSALAMVVASRLNRGYVQTLEQSLLKQAEELDLSKVEDTNTRTGLQTLRDRTVTSREKPSRETEAPAPSAPPGAMAGRDPELHDITELRSRDRDRIRRVLRHEEGVPAALVPHVIALLAWEPVADDAVFALRKVAEERVGELTDALIDPSQAFALRRRLARVFSVCVSQRAVDGLILGLDDARFEVRFQCGRSLAAILDKNPQVKVDETRVFDVVLRELAVGRPVWESRQLLDRLDDPDQRSFVDEFIENRANQGLAHVFTLLSLVLPTEALRTAYRALHTDDQRLRGTALEYLEGVLPPPIREALWPLLEDRREGKKATRSREEIMADLLQSNQSIMLNLEELKRRASATPAAGETTGKSGEQLARS